MKQRIIPVLALTALLLLPPTAQAAPTVWGYSEGLALVSENDQWGYVDASGAIVISIQYQSANSFSLGLAQVQLNNKLGVIRQDGTYLIKPQYDTLKHVSSGVYLAQKGNTWGVISILPFQGASGQSNILYDFVYDSAELTRTGGVDTLVLTQGQSRVMLPLFEIQTILIQRQVPSAHFPLNQGKLPSFTDVSPRDWSALWVDLAYNVGLMEGVGEGRFAPQQTLTVAEAIKLAAQMESRYQGDNFHEQKPVSPVWYRPSVDYCVASGIIREGEFNDYTRTITRAEMARIFAATSLGKSLPTLNSLERIRAQLPDVTAGSYAADAIYGLYAKGVLTGGDQALTFRPNDSLTRAEAAAIVSRMARAEQRVTLWPGSYYRRVPPLTPAPQETPVAG